VQEVYTEILTTAAGFTACPVVVLDLLQENLSRCVLVPVPLLYAAYVNPGRPVVHVADIFVVVDGILFLLAVDASERRATGFDVLTSFECDFPRLRGFYGCEPSVTDSEP